MPNYRRSHVPGGTYFFTVKTELNVPIFADQSRAAQLGNIFREAITLWPFEINAIVLLPDHLHAIWSLPCGDDDYSKRWGWIKKEFTKIYLATDGQEQFTSASKKRHRRRGVWQRKFWEHTIEDEDDYEAHFDYIHWNPVKHGYVKCPSDWPHSSFNKWVSKGVYPPNWGCGERIPHSRSNIVDAGE